MKAFLLPCLAAISAAVLFVETAAAAVLVRYEFGTPGTETEPLPVGTRETGAPFAPTVLGLGVTATPITDAGPGIHIMTSSAATAPAHAPFLRTEPGATTASGAVTNGSYFTFTLSATGGQTLLLDDLTFLAARGGGGTPRGYAVRSSADNYATELSQADLGTVRPDFTPINVNLSGPSFQNVETITFRVYSYSPAAGQSVDYDNFQVTGSVIPEPGAAALSLLAGSVLLLRRRRLA